MSSTIEQLAQETRCYPVPESFAKSATITENQLTVLHQASHDDFEGYWRSHARAQLTWFTPFSKTLNQEHAPFYRWFEDGTLNASYQCLDVPIEQGFAHKVALIFESDQGEVTQVTYEQLRQQVSQFANGLKALGYQKGHKAIIYMPMSIEAVCAMQACARLGIIHSVVFGGFSAQSLQERIQDIQAELVITADAQYRGGKCLLLKESVDQALANQACPTVRHTIVYERAKLNLPLLDQQLSWQQVVAGQLDVCPAVAVEAEHPLFVLYTSGSTGRPKGIQHSTAGYLLHAKLTMQWVFDIKPNDVFWCTADVGWITGHTYVAYGPLAVGATQIIFEGVPTYPDAGRFWQMIQHHKISIFYTAPTAIRALIRASSQQPHTHPNHYNIASLRLLGSVGEPINPEAWQWYFEHVGRSQCPIVDTWWQTETGGHLIAPIPGVTALKPGSCTFALPGIMAGVVDEAGNDLPPNQGGLLVIKAPWPSMARTIWNDPERFKEAYFPKNLKGYYLAGDGALRDQDGYFWMMGRIDDVLNVSGHRLGTIELESALVAHPQVAEAAVVGKQDDITGEAIVAFVVLKFSSNDSDDLQRLALSLRDWVSQQIGPIAKPKEIRFGDGLPKTRSGKIMRRLLKSIANDQVITQDTSTLENPAVLQQLQQHKH